MMNKIMRILCFVFALLLLVICVNLVVAIIEIVIDYNETLSYDAPETKIWRAKYTSKIISERVVYFLICSSASALLFVGNVRNLLNFTRLTYEQYKEERAKKKAEKQAKKIQKLQNELKRLEE